MAFVPTTQAPVHTTQASVPLNQLTAEQTIYRVLNRSIEDIGFLNFLNILPYTAGSLALGQGSLKMGRKSIFVEVAKPTITKSKDACLLPTAEDIKADSVELVFDDFLQINEKICLVCDSLDQFDAQNRLREQAKALGKSVLTELLTSVKTKAVSVDTIVKTRREQLLQAIVKAEEEESDVANLVFLLSPSAQAEIISDPLYVSANYQRVEEVQKLGTGYVGSFNGVPVFVSAQLKGADAIQGYLLDREMFLGGVVCEYSQIIQGGVTTSGTGATLKVQEDIATRLVSSYGYGFAFLGGTKPAVYSLPKVFPTA